MSTPTTWIVVQNIQKKSDEQLIVYSRGVKQSIEGDTVSAPPVPNPYFAAPNPVPANPTMAELGTAVDAFETAFLKPKGIVRTTAIRSARTALKIKLNAVGNYVESIANLPTNIAVGDAVIVSANMEVKKATGGFKAEGLTIKNDPKQKGNMTARDKRFADGTVYAWFVKLKNAPNYAPAVRVGTAARYTYTGLTSGGIYAFKTERTAPDGSITVSEEVEETVL